MKTIGKVKVSVAKPTPTTPIKLKRYKGTKRTAAGAFQPVRWTVMFAYWNRFLIHAGSLRQSRTAYTFTS